MDDAPQIEFDLTPPCADFVARMEADQDGQARWVLLRLRPDQLAGLTEAHDAFARHAHQGTYGEQEAKRRAMEALSEVQPPQAWELEERPDLEVDRDGDPLEEVLGTKGVARVPLGRLPLHEANQVRCVGTSWKEGRLGLRFREPTGEEELEVCLPAVARLEYIQRELDSETPRRSSPGEETSRTTLKQAGGRDPTRWRGSRRS